MSVTIIYIIILVSVLAATGGVLLYGRDTNRDTDEQILDDLRAEYGDSRTNLRPSPRHKKK